MTTQMHHLNRTYYQKLIIEARFPIIRCVINSDSKKKMIIYVFMSRPKIPQPQNKCLIQHNESFMCLYMYQTFIILHLYKDEMIYIFFFFHCMLQ